MDKESIVVESEDGSIMNIDLSNNPISVLSNIKLPNEWKLYLYNKALFKKIANDPNINIRKKKPYEEKCTITSLNDLVYILQLMDVKNTAKNSSTNKVDNTKKNLDAHDYIIMRKGIEPIWEDPKNSKGGTFTIKMNHSKGYEVWSLFLMYILGETFSNENENINGITVSYISNEYDTVNKGNPQKYTYIKIWDAMPNRTRAEFINLIPKDIFCLIESDSLMYTQNFTKKDYGQEKIINKINETRNRNYNNTNNGARKSRGGFVAKGNRNR